LYSATNGNGMAAQRKAVEDYLNGGRWKLVGEFTEVESGKRSDRPELEKAAAKRAEKTFNRLMDKGYVGGKRMADGSLKKIRKFDPTAEEIFVHRQLVGG
jgi:hypothetical protein